jgi:RHS repeat-associated protein
LVTVRNFRHSPDTTGAGTTTVTRYAELIDGDLGLTLTTTGSTNTAELALATPRGDTPATVTLPARATSPTGTPATGIDYWADYTEYGQPSQPVSHDPGSVLGIGYGWLGAKQRASHSIGLTIMGARLYNQATGLFTSTDPVYGGTPTAFTYPNDPVNSNDISGNWTKYTKNENGTWVPVRDNVRKKLLKKHGLKWKTVKKMMPKLAYSHKEGSDRIYRGVAIEVKCSIFRGCWNTGKWVVVKAIVNFRRGSDRKTIGMKSMYCEGMRVCPRWINKKIWN